MLRINVAAPLAALLVFSVSCSNGDDSPSGQGGDPSKAASGLAGPPRLPASEEPRDPGFVKLIQDRVAAAERAPGSADAWGSLGLAYDAHDGLDGDFGEPAVQCYTQAADLDQSEFRWPYLAGSIIYRTNQADAILWLDRALAADADRAGRYAPLFVRRGIGRLGIGDVEGAREDFQKATQLDPRLVLAWMGVARVELADDDAAAALKALKRANAAGPTTDEIHGLFAEAHRRLGDEEAAAAALALMQDGGLREQLPDLYRAEVMIEGISVKWARQRAQALAQNQRFDDAVATWQRVIDQADQIDAHFALADLLIRGQRLAEASAILTQLEERLAGPNAAAEDRAQLEFQLGVMALTQREQERAIEHFEAALALDESHAIARGNLGMVLAGRGDLALGLEHLRRACLELGPESSMHINLLGVLERAALWDELGEVLDRYEEARGADGRTSFMRGRMLASQQQFEGAAVAFGKAAEFEPGNESAVTNQARALRRVGDEVGAVGVLRTAYRRLTKPSIRASAPTSGLRVAKDLSWALATTPDIRVVEGGFAVRLAREVLALDPKNPEFLDLTAAALAADGAFEEAVEHSKRAIKIMTDVPPGQAPPNRADLLVAMGVRQAAYRAGRRWTR